MYFVGLENFKWVFFDDKFINVFKWMWIFVFMSVILKVFVGLFFSLFYNSKYVKGKVIYRLFFIIFWVLLFFFLVIVWKFMFDFVFGLINFVFKLIGIIGFDWVNNLIWGFVVFNIIEVWLVYLFMMIVIIVVF